MAFKAIVPLVLLAGAAVSGARAAEQEQQMNLCPDGGVRFQGRVNFEEDERPTKVARGTKLTVDLLEEGGEGAMPPPSLYTFELPLSGYTQEKELKYGFCADIGEARAEKLSLKAHIVDEEDEKVEFLGETVVAAGSDTYEADLTLTKVSGTASTFRPTVADCEFAELDDDVTGIAVNASIKVDLRKALPKPSYLAVTLHDVSNEEEEAEVISVFAGDVSGLYEAGKPLPAFLCAKVPAAGESIMYALEATLHVGWDGFESPTAEDRTPKKGDFVSQKVTPVVVVPGQADYTVAVEVKPYKA